MTESEGNKKRKASRSPQENENPVGFSLSIGSEDTSVEASSTKTPLQFPKKANERSHRWQFEISRTKPTFTSTGQAKGYGSWYERMPGNYSRSEFKAEKGNRDRVRTADCRKEDKEARRSSNDDSGLESDWLDRTSLDNKEFRMRHILAGLKEKKPAAKPAKKRRQKKQD